MTALNNGPQLHQDKNKLGSPGTSGKSNSAANRKFPYYYTGLLHKTICMLMFAYLSKWYLFRWLKITEFSMKITSQIYVILQYKI